MVKDCKLEEGCTWKGVFLLSHTKQENCSGRESPNAIGGYEVVKEEKKVGGDRSLPNEGRDAQVQGAGRRQLRF